MMSRHTATVAKFIGVGGAATLFQYSLLIIFVELDLLTPVPASVVSFALSSLLNYLLNYYFTFQSNANHNIAMIRFFLVASIGLIMNASIMYLLVEYLDFHYIISQLAATVTVLFWNFIIHKKWTYKNK